MKKYISLILIGIGIGLLLFTTGAMAQPRSNLSPDASPYVEGELIVKIIPGADIDQIIKNIGLDIESTKVLSKIMRIWQITFSSDYEVTDFVDEFNKNPGVIVAQPNHYISWRITTPDDPEFPLQWNLETIDAEFAWDFGTGASGATVNGDPIVVAILDGGFDLVHEDIVFWTNVQEIDNNGIDDDLNGYVDDVNGWNAGTSDDNITSDDHGTHVTGIAAAQGNNNTDISGVTWNAQVMPVQVTSAVETEVVMAYDYVLANRVLYNTTNGASGAFVVATNASFGVDFADPALYPIWCDIYNDLGAAGILNAGATTNLFIDVDVQGDVPSGCGSTYLVAVTETNQNDINTDAGFGTTAIDIAAPGKSVLSTMPGDTVGYKSGTSMATPHVTGTIALLYAIACEEFINNAYVNPDQAALAMRSFILDGADIIDTLLNQVDQGRRLNMNGSVLELLNSEICCPEELSLSLPINSDKIFVAEERIIATNEITSGASVEYRAGEEVLLKPDFFAELGTDFLAHIGPCVILPETGEGMAPEYFDLAITTPDESQENAKLSVYPNPTSETVTIQLELNNPERVFIRLVDLAGKNIYTVSNRQLLDQGIHKFEILRSNLPQGLLFVQIQFGNKKPVIRKLIVQ